MSIVIQGSSASPAVSHLPKQNKRGASQALQRYFGHCGLQTASEVRFDLKIEISDINNPDIYVHIASKSHFHDL